MVVRKKKRTLKFECGKLPPALIDTLRLKQHGVKDGVWTIRVAQSVCVCGWKRCD